MKITRRRAAPAASEAGAEVRVAWAESLVFCGPYPVAHKRFYKTETLKSAFEKALRERDRFLYAGIQALMGRAPLSAFAFDLVYEDAVRLLFRVSVTNRARKRVALRLVMAKNHEECSARILEEYESLAELHRRAPEMVISPCGHGIVFLPDRHRRRDLNREVFGYIAKDIPEAAPLYAASSGQLAPHGEKPRRYSIKDSEEYRVKIVKMAAKFYDERALSGLDPGGLYPECLGAGKDKDGAPSLVLTQCRSLRRRYRPHMLVGDLLFSALTTGAAVFPMAPAHPARFFDALCGAVSHDTARKWCRSFFEKGGALNTREHEELLPGRDYLAALASLAEGG